MWFTSPSKKFRKKWKTATKMTSSAVCAPISKRIRTNAKDRLKAAGAAAVLPCGSNYLGKLRRTVSAALCRDRNDHRALRALLGGRRRCWCWLLGPTIDLPHQQEDEKSNDQEIDDRV